jgi:hypothetical protein
MAIGCVIFEARTGCLNFIKTSFGFRWLNCIFVIICHDDCWWHYHIEWSIRRRQTAHAVSELACVVQCVTFIYRKCRKQYNRCKCRQVCKSDLVAQDMCQENYCVLRSCLSLQNLIPCFKIVSWVELAGWLVSWCRCWYYLWLLLISRERMQSAAT